MAKRKSPQNIYFCQSHTRDTSLLTREEFRQRVINHLEKVAPKLSGDDFKKVTDQILGVWDRSDLVSDSKGKRELAAVCRSYLGDEEHIENPYMDSYAEQEHIAQIFARSFRTEFTGMLDDALSNKKLNVVYAFFEEMTKKIIKNRGFAITGAMFVLLISSLSYSSFIGHAFKNESQTSIHESGNDLVSVSNYTITQSAVSENRSEHEIYKQVFNEFSNGYIAHSKKEANNLLEKNPKPVYRAGLYSILAKIHLRELDLDGAEGYFRLAKDYYIKMGLVLDILYVDIDYLYLMAERSEPIESIATNIRSIEVRLDDLESKLMQEPTQAEGVVAVNKLRRNLLDAKAYSSFRRNDFKGYLKSCQDKLVVAKTLNNESILWALNDCAIAELFCGDYEKGRALYKDAYIRSLDTRMAGFKYYHLLGEIIIEKRRNENYSYTAELIKEYATSQNDRRLLRFVRFLVS